jgi:hypothetical protein
MPPTKTAVAEAIGLMDFDTDEMEPGDVSINYAPRPPEEIVACWIDAAGAPHFYSLFCTGTVPGDKPDELQRVWVPEDREPSKPVISAINDRAGVYASRDEFRSLDGFTETPGHPL